jgi:hypothetical protein
MSERRYCTCEHVTSLHTTMNGLVGLPNACTAPDCDCSEVRGS